MKKVTVSAVCDRCNAPVDENDPGHGILVALGQKKPVEVDLCNACLELAQDALGSAIASGVTPRNSSSGNGRPRGNWGKREQVACPLCSKSIASGAGQVMHARKIHGLEREEVWVPEPALV